MKLAAIVAMLAACGGLASQAAVDHAMREAAPAAPERDFRSLMDMVQQAVQAQMDANCAPNERMYCCIEAMYADRAVIECGGKHWQYPYTIQVVDGTERVVLGAPVQVVEQFVPVAGAKPGAAASPSAGGGGMNMTEARGAAGFREAADGSIEVTILRAGQSINGNYYSDAALKEGAPLFEGVRVFVKSDAEHIKGGGKDVRNLVGGIYDVKFVEGAQPDTGALVGTLRPLDDADPAVTKMREAVKKGMTNLLGLSIDATAKTKARVQGGKRLREATKFIKVNSVDVIVEPGAGGGLDRLTEAAADEPLKGEKTMPLWKQRMLEAIKAKDATKYAAIDTATVKDDDVVALYEAVAGPLTPADTQAMREAAGAEPVTRADLQMIELRARARDKIAASKLPAPAKERLVQQFAGMAQFTEAAVADAIKAEGDYIARMTESGAVRVPAFGAGSIVVGDRSVAIRDMLDAFYDPAHKDHKSVHSFKECYIEITGDRRVTGDFRNVDKSRLAESVGEFTESVDSTTFANALGDSITRRMQAVFTGLTNLQDWRRVATVAPVSDFRTQERIRVGGYGNLPAVAQSGAYGALASPGDEKATYAVTKRGGTEDVTLEAIRNDDVGALRRIPMELAQAAGNTLYEFVFDFFRTNPAIYDTVALYHAAHNNLFAAALDATQYATHRLSMLKQTRAGSAKRMAVAPSFVLVPFELQETAYNLFVRGTNLDKTFVQDLNPTVIPVAYWTDANDWCTVADPNVLPVLEIGFLDGKEEPELFVQDMPNVGSMFTNDKLTYKIRHIYGGNVLVDGFKATTKAVVA